MVWDGTSWVRGHLIVVLLTNVSVQRFALSDAYVINLILPVLYTKIRPAVCVRTWRENVARYPSAGCYVGLKVRVYGSEKYVQSET